MIFSSPRYVSTILPLAQWCFADQPTVAHHATTIVKPLYDIVPNCSLHCINTFIQTDYPIGVCSRRTDINCLCRTNTTSGFTFGEAALRCVLSFCRRRVGSNSDAYDICNPVAGALPRTHATITATVAPEHTPTPPRQAGGVNSTSVSCTSSTSVHLTTSTSRQTATTVSSSHSQPPTYTTTKGSHSVSSSSPTNTNAGETSNPAGTSHSLNSGAVIGISVASGISFAFIIAVIFFFCCRRLRKKRRKEDHPNFFEIGGFMTEPPEFSLPPTRRPTPGPRSYISTANRDQEQQAMPQFNPGNHYPGLRLDHARSAGHDGTAQIGVAVSPESEIETSPMSQTSQRTVSELLPDKPELYPEPLRLSRQNHSRPNSEATLFEEDTVGRRLSTHGAVDSWEGSSGSASNGSRPYNRAPMLGLPPNPRALIQCFEGARGAFPNRSRPGQPTSPVFTNGGRGTQTNSAAAWNPSPTRRQANFPEREGYNARHWQESSDGPRGDPNQPLSPNMVSRPFHAPGPNYHFLENLNPGLDTAVAGEWQARGCARNSGFLRPLTPVREVRTPGTSAAAANRDYFNKLADIPDTINPANEIVSRPRIVRQDDIKRVQIRKGRPQPRELKMPYSPDDYWLEHGREHWTPGMVGSRPWNRSSGDGMYGWGHSRAFKHPGRHPPGEHHLTPSRRGADLILRVD